MQVGVHFSDENAYFAGGEFGRKTFLAESWIFEEGKCKCYMLEEWSGANVIKAGDYPSKAPFRWSTLG
jgi:hypothetical protein